jgi:hypothetical protein
MIIDPEMHAFERAARLTLEGGAVLDLIHFEALIAPYAKIYYNGSFYLNVMVYPDIDVYVSKVSLDTLFKIGGQLAGSEAVVQVVFEKSNDPHLPGGLYLKPRVAYGHWGRPWKIDIWSLDEDLIERQMAPMRRYKEAMTEDLREQILEYKLSVMTGQGRTPMGSGFYIYKAFIDEGLTDFARVTEYLVANGVRMG